MTNPNECHARYHSKFDFFFPTAPLFARLFPHLTAGFDRGLFSESAAIERGLRYLEAIIRRKLRRWAPLTVDDAPDIVTDLLLRLAETGRGNSYDSNLGGGWALVDKITHFVIIEAFRKRIRGGYAEVDLDLHDGSGISPAEAAIHREEIEGAKKQYANLNARQQWAVWRSYQFLPPTEPVASPNEYMDRHRGLRAIARAMNDAEAI